MLFTDFEEILYALRDGSEKYRLSPLSPDAEEAHHAINGLIREWKKEIHPVLASAIAVHQQGNESGILAQVNHYDELVHPYVDAIIGFVHHLTVHFEMQTTKFRTLTFVYVAFATVFTLLLFVYFRRTVVVLVRTLSGAAKEISRGDLSVRVKEQGDKDISGLASSFNRMAKSLEELFAEKSTVLQQNRALYNASKSIMENLEMEVLLQRIVDEAREIVGSRFAAITILAEEGEYRYYIPSGLSPEEYQEMLAKMGLPMGRGLLGYLLKEGTPLRLDDISTHPASIGFPEGHPPMKTFLGVPISLGEKVIGRLYFTEKKDGTAFTREDEDTAASFAGVATLAINNARLAAEIEASRARIDFLLTSNPSVIYSCKADGDYGATYISENIQRQLGYAPDDFIQDSSFWLNHMHPDDVDRVLAGLGKVFEDEEHVHEYRFLHADGRYRWMRDELRLLRDNEGRPVEMVGNWIDITGQKEIEIAVNNANHLLQSISRAQAQYISEEKPRVLFNELLDDLLSVTNSEYGFIGEVLYDEKEDPFLKAHAITDISWSAETRALYEKVDHDGMEFRKLKSLIGEVMTSKGSVISNDPSSDQRAGGFPEGHPLIRSYLGLPFKKGERVIGMIGVANRPGGYDDRIVAFLRPLLTTCANVVEALRLAKESRLAEENLRTSEKKYRELMESVPIGIITSTLSGQVLAANTAILQVAGYDSMEEFLKLPISQHYSDPADLERLIELLKQGPVNDFELRVRRKNGSCLWASANSSLKVSATGETLLLTSLQDITMRKKAKEQLHEYKNELKLLNESYRTLLTSKNLDAVYLDICRIAHEVFNLQMAWDRCC